ncbi:MAG: hypothetical protein AUJ20_03355 [Comamonadaceae bacterium CG1_02_60_18]|nr:MAG: hypothetical protein AUJ20_03355 [Comamonadaceae bacterium CG1_02_60_18]PIQ50646.1 MAG: hypothetical protein COW02_18695 [Comamonadaceae bacterium CG12_big_fil_rev_8_21_14_0_65_59_15]
MRLSNYFCALRSGYQAELDDLTSDSEGRDVLQKRLKEKRSQIAFLGQMMETAPEMVAVVFHGAFDFKLPAVMEQLLRTEPDDLPDWDSLADAVHLAPWAQALAEPLLAQPEGQRFLTVAGALEYLTQRHKYVNHAAHPEAAPAHDTLLQGGRQLGLDEEDDPNASDLDHDEAGAHWLEEQGFDRKE